MKVELVSIGDELLIGQTVNTNASWLGETLSQLGATIEYGTTIQDNMNQMLDAFERAMGRVDVVIVTGGLGPTKDDFTKTAICKYFNTELVRNEKILRFVQEFFRTRNLPFLDVNVYQADIPAIAEPLQNDNGTAPGIWIEENGKIFVSLPGVPYEMKWIVTNHVIPRLEERFGASNFYYKTLKTQGIGETYIAERIEDIETQLRAKGLGLAYLPSPGSVRLRFTGEDKQEHRMLIDSYINEILQRIPQYAYGIGDVSLEQVIGELLTEKKLTVSTVESCSAGSVASTIVNMPGASTYFMGGIVSYSNDIKSSLVNVSSDTLEKYGAVSEQVVMEMASGGKELMKTDYCIATTGVAGPDGGSEEKPVGTVWIAITGPERVLTKKFLFEKDRERNIRRTVKTALNMLRCELQGIKVEKN